MRDFTGLLGGLIWLANKLLKLLLARTVEVGSRTLVHAALAGDQSEMQGRYLNRCRVEEESDFALSEEGGKVEEKIWVGHVSESSRLTSSELTVGVLFCRRKRWTF